MCTAEADCVPVSPSAPASPSQPYPSYPQPFPQYPQPYPAQGPYWPPGGYVYPYYPMPPAEEPLPAVPEPPRPGDRNHDGFFLRMGIGPGGRGGTTSSAVVLTQLDLGYTVARNLVLAAGFYGSTGIDNETFTVDGRSVNTGTNAASTLAGTVVYYVDPHKGLHFELLAGTAAVVVNKIEPDLSRSHVGWGFAGGGGGGYEWWISPNWSLGALARVTYAQAHVPLDRESLVAADSVEFRLISVGVVFAATYH
jgi:hypothetical protein